MQLIVAVALAEYHRIQDSRIGLVDYTFSLFYFVPFSTFEIFLFLFHLLIIFDFFFLHPFDSTIRVPILCEKY